MKCDLDWLVGRSLVEVVLHKGPSWGFHFGDGTEIRADSPWRLIRGGRIVLSSEDHEQSYGLSRPIDAADLCRTMIGGAVVRSAEVRDGTRDIIILFEIGRLPGSHTAFFRLRELAGRGAGWLDHHRPRGRQPSGLAGRRLRLHCTKLGLPSAFAPPGANRD